VAWAASLACGSGARADTEDACSNEGEADSEPALELGREVELVLSGDHDGPLDCHAPRPGPEVLRFVPPYESRYRVTAQGEGTYEIAHHPDCDSSASACAYAAREAALELEASQPTRIGIAGSEGRVAVRVQEVSPQACPDENLVIDVLPLALARDSSQSVGRFSSGCGGEGDEDILAFTVPRGGGGTFGFRAHSDAFDPSLWLRAGCAGEELACNDDIEVGLDASMGAVLEEGREFALGVDTLSPDGGPYTLHVDRLVDGCPTTDLGMVLPVEVAGDTDELVNAHGSRCGGWTERDALFTWTAAAAGTIEVRLHDPDAPGLLAVWEGGCGGTLLACGAGTESGGQPIVLEVQAGAALMIAVDGLRAGAGAFTLAIAGSGDAPTGAATVASWRR
jgi:hypothetical protein